MIQAYFGLTVAEWEALQEYRTRFSGQVPGADAILRELVELRGKLSFVQSRVDQMKEVLNARDN